MEVEPTSFPFFRLSPSLCVFKPVYLFEPTCAQLTTRAPELNLNKVTPWLAGRGPESSHVMGDEDGDKRQKYLYFEDRKRERERQLKEKKKRLDGSDSEVDEGDVKERKQTQMRAYDTLTLLGTATCTTPSQTKGTTETEHLSSELNKIELNKTTN